MEIGTKVVITAKGERNGAMGQYLGVAPNDTSSNPAHLIGFADGKTLLFKYSEFTAMDQMKKKRKKRKTKEELAEERKKINFKDIDPRTGEKRVLSSDDIVPPPEDEKKKMGRPTIYTKELAAKICKGLMDGKSLRSVLREDGMPNGDTVFMWLFDKPDFSEQYTRACEARSEAFAEDILEISDDTSNDTMVVKIGGKEVEMPNKEHMLRSKLRVDTRQWLMTKMKPRKYGNKMDVTSDNKPIQGNTIIFKDFVDKPNATDSQ